MSLRNRMLVLPIILDEPAPPSIMDATVDDPHNGSTFFVDLHIVDSLVPSHLHIQKPGDPASQSSLQRCVRDAIKVKADTYQREAEHRDPPAATVRHDSGWRFHPSRP